MTLRLQDLSKLQPSIDRKILQQSQRANFETTATPELSDRLGKSYLFGRFTSPEIAASAAVAGISKLEDLHANIATQLLKQGTLPQKEISKDDPLSLYSDFFNAESGDTVTIPDPKTGKPITVTVNPGATSAVTASGQKATGLRVRSQQEKDAEIKRQKDLEKRVPIIDMDKSSNMFYIGGVQGPSGFTPPSSASELIGTGFKIVGLPFHFTGAALGMMAPDQLKFIGTGVRAFTKTVAAIEQTAADTIYNSVRLTLRDAMIAGSTDASPFERFLMAADPRKLLNNGAASLFSSTGVTALADLVSGDLDTGAGFFIRGKTGERTENLQSTFAGTKAEALGIDPRTIYSAPGVNESLSKPFDTGFIAGEMLVDAKLTSRDSEVYQLFEDTFNTGLRLVSDPGIYGVGFSDILVKNLAIKFGVTRQVAKSYLAAKQTKKYEEALRIAVENGMDVKQAEYLSDAERLTNLAGDLVAQKENIVYSGDRGFAETDQVTKFKDIDDPDFVVNRANYLGEGLYVTDSIFPASSTGYNTPGLLSVNDAPNVITPFGVVKGESKYFVLRDSGVLPPDINLSQVALSSPDVPAGVWKFDKSNLNIIDFDDFADNAPEVFETMLSAAKKNIEEYSSAHTNFNVQKMKDFESSKDLFSGHRLLGSNLLDDIKSRKEEATYFFSRYNSIFNKEKTINFVDDITNENLSFSTVDEYMDWLKQRPNYILHLSRTESLRNFLMSELKIDEELASDIAWRLTEHAYYISGESGGNPISIGRKLVQSFEDKTTNIPNGEVFRELIRQIGYLQNIIDNESPYRYFKLSNFYDDSKINFTPELQNKLLTEVLKIFYDETEIAEIVKNRFIYDPVAAMKANRNRDYPLNPVVKALVDAGYDGMRYNGGSIIGGTGNHNAYVIWKPSKMQHLDVLSGEKFPINQLVDNLEEANRVGYRADEIEGLKGIQDGWKNGMGLIGMDPKMVDATQINNIKFSKFGKSILQAIADESNPVVIWRTFLKEKSPYAAIRLAKASTADEVFDVLREVVDSGDTNMNLRELPNGWKDWVSDTGFKVKQNVDRFSKQTAMMPDSTYIAFDDPATALSRTDRVLQIVGVKGAERDGVLKVLFNAIEENTSKSWDTFFAVANETSLRKKMVQAGWTEEQIKAFTSYRRKGDNITRWTLEDLADNIPIEWFDEGDGPLRITQLLSGGGWLLEPEVIDELMRDLNPVIKGLRKLSSENPRVATAIDTQRTISRAIENASSAWVKPAALGAPLPFRYVMRVVPEETLRVAFSGNFENLGQYMAQIITGHLNYDTFGRTIRSSADVAEEMAVLAELKDEYLRLVDPLNAASDTAKVQRRITKIEKKYGTETEIQARIDELSLQIDNNIPGDQRSLVNKVKGHLESTYDPSTLDSYMERSGVQQAVTNKVADVSNVSKKEKAQRTLWVEAQARDIADMAANADYRAIAKALQTGDASALESVAQDLLSGDLRPIYDEYTKNVWGAKKGWDWETIEAARSRVKEIATDIKQRTALADEVLEAVANNLHAGEKLSNPLIDDVYNASDSFKQLIKDTLLDNPDAPPLVPHNPLISTTPNATRNNNFMYKSFGLYTKASAALARNPLWAQAYWKRVTEMISAMEPSEAAALVADNVGKLPDYLVDKLNDSLPTAKGTLTRNEVSRISEVHAREVTDGLLFNAQNNKSYVAYRHPLFFMFFDAYREQWTTWLKLMKQPRNIHKVDVATRELSRFREPFTKEDNTILHNDPISGKQVITAPLSRAFLGLFGGDANFSIPTRNLSFVGSSIPTVGPVVSILASSWNPPNETWAKLKQSFAPFSGSNTSVDWRDYFIPQFAQLAATGVANKGKEKFESFDFLWGTIEKLSGENTEKVKKASIIPIIRQLSTQIDKYPLTPEGRKQLIEDADSLSNDFAIARSFARAFLPGAPITQYYVDTKKGNLLQGMLLDEIRLTENEVFAKGGNLSQAVNTLFDKWGTGIWAFFGSSSETFIPGLQPTEEYQKWVFENKGTLKKYPIAGGYLGPQIGEYNARIFTQQTLLSQRKPKDPVVSLEDAANIMAEAYYDYQMSTIPTEYEGTPDAEQFSNQIKTEVETRFPSWSPLESTADAQVKRRIQFQELNKMVNDKSVNTTPAVLALKNYLNTRNDSVQKMIDFAPNDINNRNWTNVQSSYSLRQYLFDEGNKMAKEIPEFSSLWQNILVREFNTKDLKQTMETAQ